MDIHEKSTNLHMDLQSEILGKLGVCIRVGRSAPPGAYRVKITYLLIKNIEPWNVTLHARSPSLPLLKLILKLLKNTRLDLGLIMNNCKVNKTKSGTQI